MEKRLAQIAQAYKGRLADFEPFPRAERRDAYGELPDSLKEIIIKEGKRYLGYEYPSIRATDFMKFSRTGNRVDYENLYFARRHALCGLTLAECTEHEGRFMDDIINGIFAICEESAWQLPPHNSYVRDTPQLLLPDATRPVLDLFACETGALLACTAFALGKELDGISPFITARIHSELMHRIITPYLEKHFWWMGKGDEPMCNWTVWCTQNVLITAFLSDLEEDAKVRVFRKAAESCDFFLKDYGEDGCCDEGAQYYRHAGLCLCNAMEILNAVSDGAFSSLFESDKIKNIAAYIMNVHVADKYYFNFADCSPIAGRAGVQEYLFGKYTKQPGLMRFAADDFRAAGGALYSDEVNQISLYHRMQNVFYRDEALNYNANVTVPRGDIFYESVGLFITGNGCFCLAVKAGGNADNHNHNDTGSFTLYKNGQPVFADIGVESYTKKTFSENRYEIWTMQSGYHNLPTIMGLDEKDGRDYHADRVETACGAEKASISMELITAYPITGHSECNGAPAAVLHDVPCTMASGAPSYRRSVTLYKEENLVQLADCTNLPDVILNFITYEKPVIENNAIKIGSLATAVFTGASPYAIEVLPITDARLKTAWEHDLYRVRLKMEGGVFTLGVR